jgi:probable F420-dependent oxidoreductase
MKFAVVLPNCLHAPVITQPWEHSLTGRDIAHVALTAERLGFSNVFVPEHFLIPTTQVDLSGDHYFDAATALAFVAGATSTITVGSLVTILPLHNPVILAKQIATLDFLSGGRALAGMGVGWIKEEYDGLGVSFPKRGRMADEYLAAMFELWHNDSPEFDGEFVSFRDLAFGPKPICRPHPPIWIGGDADGALRRAARFGDGWAPWITPPDQLPARLEFLRSQPGFDDRPFSVYYTWSHLDIGASHENKHDPKAQFGQTPQEVVDRYGELAGLGVTDTWVTPPRVNDLNAYMDHMQWVAEEIIPNVS